MEALLAFAATLVSLRLSADLVRRHRSAPAPGPARLGRRARRLRRRLGRDRVGLGGRLEQPGLPRLLPLRRPARRGAARRRLAAAGRRPLGRAADARLRRARDRGRDRRAADGARRRQLDPRGPGAPRALPGPGPRDRGQLASAPLAAVVVARSGSGDARSATRSSSPGSSSPRSAVRSPASARRSRRCSRPRPRCCSTPASSCLVAHRRRGPDARPEPAGAAP